MAELNLNQIISRLNAEFEGDTRKLVFWYDDKGEFAEDIATIKLENAKVLQLKPDNQFYTKNFLERVDTTTSYLIYAPFPKPDVKENHLEDTLLYSKRFFADRASLLCVDLHIAERYRPIIERHIRFFNEKQRTQRFYDLEIENYNEENIVVGLLSAICKTKNCSFEEVMRVILTDGSLEDNEFLSEMAKYDLIAPFWKLCEQQFGYSEAEPSLERLLVTMFVTYTARSLHGSIPAAWGNFLSHKSGDIMAFLDNLMNNRLYGVKYDELARHIAEGLQAENVLRGYPSEDIMDCETFPVVDSILIDWIAERLMAEDVGAKLDGETIHEICERRLKMHFGAQFATEYRMLEAACHVVETAHYAAQTGFRNIIERYEAEDYRIDRAYRKFYYYFDKLEDDEKYQELRSLVENIYTNEYLANLLPRWNAGLQEDAALSVRPLQRDFYKNRVKPVHDKVVIIISDAMRYEVGRELYERFVDDAKCTADFGVQLSVLPSYTRLGMAALLPHKALTMTDAYSVLADDVLCDNLAGREKVLQSYRENSCCVQFDDMKGQGRAELRKIFTGMEVVYVYHNQIDARGDKLNTENEVFVACEEAIQEIFDFVHLLASSVNTYHCIITSDHGFIYKRDKLSESDKIDGISGKDALINRRFVVSGAAVDSEGVNHLSMGTVLGNDDAKVVSFPVGSNVFKVTGGGQNFVHGGSSPQEMLVPIIDVKTEKAKTETTAVKIALVSMVQKITNLIVTMDFIQSEPVSDSVKATTYKLYFMSEDNEKISNEAMYVADSRDGDAQKRIFRERFTFKNKKYDKTKQYFLIAEDTTGYELFRHPVLMDIAFADDFGFGF